MLNIRTEYSYKYGLWKKVVRPPVVLGRDCGGWDWERSLTPTLDDYETDRKEEKKTPDRM